VPGNRLQALARSASGKERLLSDAFVWLPRQTIAVFLRLLVLAVDDGGWTTASAHSGLVGVLGIERLRFAIVVMLRRVDRVGIVVVFALHQCLLGYQRG